MIGFLSWRSEFNVYVKTDIPGRRHHEVVDTRIEVLGRSDGFGVEWRLAIHHPEITAYERYGNVAYPKPFTRNRITDGQFLQAHVRRI